MASVMINPAKTDPGDIVTKSKAEQDITEQLQNEMSKFCDSLMTDGDKFDESCAFELLRNYILRHDRILYTPISHRIYACYDDHPNDADQLLDNMISNAGRLVTFGHRPDIIDKSKGQSKDAESYKDTSKSLLKIWNHINLAKQQYSVLKQSDTEFQEKFMKKFDADVRPEMDKMSKESMDRLLTLVSIFTALAFMIFGSISSMDNMFNDQNISITRLMILGSVWGLGVMNIVFVFLYCVGKITHVNFKATQKENASIFQKYPIVWWCNFFISFIFTVSCWIHVLKNKDGFNWFYSFIKSRPKCTSIVGTILLLLVFIVLGCLLWKKTKGEVDSYV